MKHKILSIAVVLIGGGLATLGGEMLSHYVWGDAKDKVVDKLTKGGNDYDDRTDSDNCGSDSDSSR